MKKKYLIIAAIIVLACLSLRLIDLSSFKPRIEEEASKASGLNVTIAGDIHLGIKGFRPALVVHDVSAVDSGKRTRITASRVGVAMPLSVNPKKFLIGIDDFILNDRKLGSYTLPLRLVDDGVEITNLKGNLEKAVIKGNFSYVADKMAADLDIQDLDYAVFAKGFTGGDADMNASITSSGKDGAGLIRNLNGQALLVGGKGKLSGNAVNLWAGNLMTTLMRGQKDETDIACIVTDFDIVKGVAASRAIIVDTAKVAVFGKGNVNLAQETMNLTFTPKPKEAAFVNLAVPVVVSGNFSQPRVTPDPQAMLKKLGGLVFTAINPALGILPMFEDGKNVEKPCDAYLAAKKKAAVK